MTEEKHKEIQLLLDRLYHVEVVTNDLKHDFEVRLSKTKTECRVHYKGKELKVNINFLDVIRGERLSIIDNARVNIQSEIIEDYIKREIER